MSDFDGKEKAVYGLSIVGSINWLTISFAEVNLVTDLGITGEVSGLVYMLIGLAGLFAGLDFLDVLDVSDMSTDSVPGTSSSSTSAGGSANE